MSNLIYMRRERLISTLAIATVALAASSVSAQYNDRLSTPDNEGRWRQWGVPSSQHTLPQAGYRSSKEQADVTATSIIGTTVQSSSGEKLGTVKDLVVNMYTHSTPFAIVASDQAIGGPKRIAVPLRDLKWSSQDQRLTLNATKEQFKAATSTPSGGWTAYSDQQWARNLDGYYGQPTVPAYTRFERQEVPGGAVMVPGNVQDRETIRAPSERKGATDLQPSPSEPENGNMSAPSGFNDEALRTRIDRNISQNPHLQSDKVQVQVDGGVVRLNGEVRDPLQKQMLENQIRSMPGVQRVEDNLRVRSP